ASSPALPRDHPSADVERPREPVVLWNFVGRLAAMAVIPTLIALSIEVVPSGMGGVRVSQISGTRPGTLYPGVHFVTPLFDYVALYDIRDQVLTTSAKDAEPTKQVQKTEGTQKQEVFNVQAREGLTIGLAITVRYRLDPKRLDYIHSNLPLPVEKEIVPPVVASVFRELVPNYTVREVFAVRREDLRRTAAEKITDKLGRDGIIVKEVMVRDIQLPAEYAKGLEGLLLKEQENEGLNFETEIRQKQVRIAELEAEAAKAREVKHAEGDAQVRVLQAKSEADAMQYTLPLKEKQIQQSRLEAEARKETTLKNAEAQAQAKVIDSKAEMERRNLLAEAEAKRIRIVASADTERMRSEATLLKENPLLINKIIAERLSDKLQIMMVPSNGKFFFNDVLKGSTPASMASQADDAESEEGDDSNAQAQQQNKNFRGASKR
ncbi:MAG: domain, Band 7 family protein, partial [Acidobacteriales bacterium]|nr:domain, Band 7 family protein [Terriglobales bacterium]